LYVIQTKKRNALVEHLKCSDIQTTIHYPLPIHLQPAYINRVRVVKNMSNTELLANEVLSLPIYPELPLEEVSTVIKSINNFFT
jgi:dTDP-4-amino-4,6-dideoxygalactose transaminase